MLRPLMIVTGVVEAAFGIAALVLPWTVIGILFVATADPTAIALARLLGAATLALGLVALLVRDALNTASGLAAAYGLALYNLLAAVLILWAAMAGLGGTALWMAGIFHTVMAGLFVYALVLKRA